VVAGLAQKLELISTQLSNTQVRSEAAAVPAVPARRSITPPLPESLIAKKSDSITPKLHDLIVRSVQ
jgi:hypothetical protein